MKPSSPSPMDDGNDDKGCGDGGEEDPNTRSTDTTPPVDGSGSDANGSGREASAEGQAGSLPAPKVARKKKKLMKTNDATATATATATTTPANSSKEANKKGKAARPFLTGRDGATAVASVVSSTSSYEPPTFVRLDRPSPSTPPHQEPDDEAAEASAASALPPPSLPSPVDAGAVAHGEWNEPPPEERLPVAITVDTSGVPTAAPVDLLATDGENDNKYDEDVNASERTKRRRSLALLILGTVALVAVTVGLSLGLTSTAPVPAPLYDTDQAAVDSRCWDEYNAFSLCLGDGGDNNSISSSRASLCGNCVATYYRSVLDLKFGEVYNVTSCQAIDNETCDALASCSDECDPCEHEFVTYFECASLCSLTGTTCKAPAATPPPTSSRAINECLEVREAFHTCVERTGQVSPCDQCVTDRLSVGSIDTCTDLRKLSCKMIDGCPACGDCEDTFLPYIRCIHADICPAFDCASPTL